MANANGGQVYWFTERACSPGQESMSKKQYICMYARLNLTAPKWKPMSKPLPVSRYDKGCTRGRGICLWISAWRYNRSKGCHMQALSANHPYGQRVCEEDQGRKEMSRMKIQQRIECAGTGKRDSGACPYPCGGTSGSLALSIGRWSRHGK